MKKKAFWDTKNPKKTSKKLTPAQKTAAKSINLQGITDLVGVVNYVGGITSRQQMLDIAGICNLIAGTTGLEPAAALREVAN